MGEGSETLFLLGRFYHGLMCFGVICGLAELCQALLLILLCIYEFTRLLFLCSWIIRLIVIGEFCAGMCAG